MCFSVCEQRKMQRWCSKLRSLAAFHKPHSAETSLSSPHSLRLLHSSSYSHHIPLSAPLFSSKISSTLNASSLLHPSRHFPTSLMQVRHITAKQRKKKLKLRRPPTPVVSKVKKIKMKGYSSYKGRFRVMKNGQIRRWKEGRQHNAHLKSNKAKRRLRLPGTVPVAYAKVMKKLGFCA